MTRSTKKGIILTAILLVVFSAVVFLIPTLKAKRFWFAYLCGIISILFMFYAIKATDGREDTKIRFFGFPAVRLGIYYLVLQLTASIVEIAAVMPTWSVLVINLLLLAFPVIGYITTQTLRKELVRQEEKQKKAS